jgi:hypothetical protein
MFRPADCFLFPKAFLLIADNSHAAPVSSDGAKLPLSHFTPLLYHAAQKHSTD